MTQPNAFLNELVSKVRPDVVGCPPVVIREHLNDAARDFFRMTTAWRHEVPQITIEDGKHTYPLSWPPNTIPNIIHEATWQQNSTSKPRPLFPMSDHAARGRTVRGPYHQTFYGINLTSDWKTQEGTPWWYTHYEDQHNVRLVPIPQSVDAGALANFTMSLIPHRTAREMPEWLMEKYFEALVSGAKGSLLKIVQKPWTNIEKAALEWDIYKSRRAEAQADVMRSHTSTPRTVQPVAPLA